MSIVETARHFGSEEDGAVTADWVVLTAAVIGLGIAAFGAVAGGVMDLADEIAHVLGTHLHTTGSIYQ